MGQDSSAPSQHPQGRFPQIPGTHLWDHPWEPSVLRPGGAATHPWLLRVLPREAPTVPSEGSTHSSILGIPRGGGCAEYPRGGRSARGDNDRRCHLLIPRGNSHGNVCPCRRVALPGAPVQGRGASGAFIPRLFFGFLENSLPRFGPHLLLQQQTATIPAASSTRSPVGWTQGVRSISQPTADGLHQNSSERSQNRHHKVGMGNSFQEEIWVLTLSPLSGIPSGQGTKFPQPPKGLLRLKK